MAGASGMDSRERKQPRPPRSAREAAASVRRSLDEVHASTRQSIDKVRGELLNLEAPRCPPASAGLGLPHTETLAARPVTKAVSRVVRHRATAGRKEMATAVMAELAPIWVRTAVTRRLTTLLLGDGSDPEQLPDETTLRALQELARRLSPLWAITSLRTPLSWWCTSRRVHDSLRDSCLSGCMEARDCLGRTLHSAPNGHWVVRRQPRDQHR